MQSYQGSAHLYTTTDNQYRALSIIAWHVRHADGQKACGSLQPHSASAIVGHFGQEEVAPRFQVRQQSAQARRERKQNVRARLGQTLRGLKEGILPADFDRWGDPVVRDVSLTHPLSLFLLLLSDLACGMCAVQ